MIYVCVDCEASGPVPPLYSLLSIGATVVRPSEGGFALGRSFYVELRPVFPGVDPEAVAVCGLDLHRLHREGLDPTVAMEKLRAWVLEENRGQEDRPVFVGHNAVFDWAYVNYYFVHYGVDNPFGYKGVDTKSLAMGRLGIGWNETSKENLQRLLNLPPQDPARVHQADYDAEYQARILLALLERSPEIRRRKGS